MQITQYRYNELENTLSRIRFRIFDYPENQSVKASRLIQKIKARLSSKWNHSSDYHWCYAAE